MMRTASAKVDATTTRDMKSNRKDDEMADTKWGPWIKHTGIGRPEGLEGSRRMQAVFINPDGKMGVDGSNSGLGLPDRSVCCHCWSANTLAYRLEIKTETYVMYGEIGRTFNGTSLSGDTHKITYVVGDGKVVSCVMEKL